MPRGRTISVLSLAVWWTKFKKVMIQMASWLVVAYGLWSVMFNITKLDVSHPRLSSLTPARLKLIVATVSIQVYMVHLDPSSCPESTFKLGPMINCDSGGDAKSENPSTN